MDDLRRVEFSREYPKTDSREIWADGAKWNEFFTLLQRAKEEGAITLVIAAPEMLGDTWREMIVNLSAIASSGLTLEIRPRYEVLTHEIDFAKDGEKDIVTGIAIECKPPLLSNPDASPVEHDMHGPFILRHGNKPFIELYSAGPDPVYCQAELLMKRDWEEFKATSRNREILGFYEITAGTIEWFLHKHKDKPTHGVLEDYRRKILASKWENFHIPMESATMLADTHKILKSKLKDKALLNSEKEILGHLKKSLDNLGRT